MRSNFCTHNTYFKKYFTSALQVALAVISVSSCTPKDYESIKKENAALKTEVDELRNGAARTVALIKRSIENKSYRESLELINKLEGHHPQDPSLADFKKKKQSLLNLIAEEDKAKQKKEMEAHALANQNNLGNWEVRRYVDDFGNHTKQKYVTRSEVISGVFSNSATQDSRLRVNVLVTSPRSFSFMLYEYDGNNPVKSYMNDEYVILIQTNAGLQIKLSGQMWRNSDRIQIQQDSARKLHEALKQGGKIDFRIVKRGGMDSYSFSIHNADWYENAIKRLSEKT